MSTAYLEHESAAAAMRIFWTLLALAPLAAAQPAPGDLAPDPGVEMWVGAPVVASWDGLAGQAVVMDLWATWCAPCVATLPHMAALADSFATRPVQFLSVTDEPYESVRPFLDERAIAGWVGIDEDGSSRRAYGVDGIPAVVLVYPDGRLAAVTFTAEVDGAVIEALLAGDPLDVEPFPVGTTMAERIAQLRANRPAVADGPATFSAGWGSPTGTGPFQMNSREGWLSAADGRLVGLLSAQWSLRFPFGEDPLGMGLRRGFVDLPDSLARKGVTAEVREPGLSQAEFGAYVLVGLAERLGLEIRFETRPTVVYALRRSAERELTLRRVGEPFGASARGATFSARVRSIGELAQRVGDSLGHPVIDESGLDQSATVTLEFDAHLVDFDPPVMTWESVEGVRAGLLAATGLELVPQVRPMEWMVVRPRKDEHAQRR